MSNCPHPTTRASGVCRQCSVERKFEHLKEQDEWRDCPECNQPTSYAEGSCYRCRGAGEQCERCGAKHTELTRRPVLELKEPMTMCHDCMEYLDGLGRLRVPMTDGGVNQQAEPDEQISTLGDVINMQLDVDDQTERRWVVLYDNDYDDFCIDADDSIALLVDNNQACELIRISSKVISDLAPEYAPDKEPIEAMIDALQEVSDR